MKEIKENIRKIESELCILRTELNEHIKTKYQFLVGKFFKISSIEIIKLTRLNHVTDINVNFSCVRLYHNNGHIEITLNDNYNLSIGNIDEKRYTEVSKEIFLEFMYGSFDETAKIINNII